MPIQSIHRVAAILDLFSTHQSRLGITDISRLLNLNKSTISSLVRTLEAVGFLEKDEETRKYVLGRKLYRLGITSANNMKINRSAIDAMRRLAQGSDFISRLAIWDKDAVLITFEVTPAPTYIRSPQIGPRIAAYCSALGRAILAYMDNAKIDSYLDHANLIAITNHTITDRDRIVSILNEVRKNGYSMVREEIVYGWISLAAPIYQADGSVEAGVGVAGTVSQFSDDVTPSLVSDLLRTAREISNNMGYNIMEV